MQKRASIIRRGPTPTYAWTVWLLVWGTLFAAYFRGTEAYPLSIISAVYLVLFVAGAVSQGVPSLVHRSSVAYSCATAIVSFAGIVGQIVFVALYNSAPASSSANYTLTGLLGFDCHGDLKPLVFDISLFVVSIVTCVPLLVHGGTTGSRKLAKVGFLVKLQLSDVNGFGVIAFLCLVTASSAFPCALSLGNLVMLFATLIHWNCSFPKKYKNLQQTFLAHNNNGSSDSEGSANAESKEQLTADTDTELPKNEHKALDTSYFLVPNRSFALFLVVYNAALLIAIYTFQLLSSFDPYIASNATGLSLNSTRYSVFLAIGLLTPPEFVTLDGALAAGPLLYQCGAIATFLMFSRIQLRQRHKASKTSASTRDQSAESKSSTLNEGGLTTDMAQETFTIATRRKQQKVARKKAAARRCNAMMAQRLVYLVSRWGAFQAYFLIPASCLACMAWAIILPGFVSAAMLAWACVAIIGVDCCKDPGALRSHKHARSNVWITIPIVLGFLAVLVDFGTSIRFYDPKSLTEDGVPSVVQLGLTLEFFDIAWLSLGSELALLFLLICCDNWQRRLQHYSFALETGRLSDAPNHLFFPKKVSKDYNESESRDIFLHDVETRRSARMLCQSCCSCSSSLHGNDRPCCSSACANLWKYIVKNTSMLFLGVLYVIALTKIDLLHAVLMVFTISGIVSSQLRRVIWRPLVVYTSLMTLSLYLCGAFFWPLMDGNVTNNANATLGGAVKENTLFVWLSWVGFTDYGLRNGQYGQLLGTDFMYEVILLICVSTQLTLYMALATMLRKAKSRAPTSSVSHHQKKLESFWLWFCYAFLFFETIGPPISIISTVDLIVLLLLFVLHMKVEFRRRLYGYWWILGICQGAFLVVRYVSQFDVAMKFLSTTWQNISLSNSVPLAELGLLQYDGAVFAELLCPTLAFAFTVFQLRLFRKHDLRRKVVGKRMGVVRSAFNMLRTRKRTSESSNSLDTPLLAVAASDSPAHSSPAGASASHVGSADGTNVLEADRDDSSTPEEPDTDTATRQSQASRCRLFFKRVYRFTLQGLLHFSVDIMYLCAIICAVIPPLLGEVDHDWQGDALSLLYLLVSVLFIMFCPRSNLGVLWIPLTFLAVLALFGNYVFQFKLFSPAVTGGDVTNSTNSSKWWPAGATSSWLGFYRLSLDSEFFTSDVGNVSVVHQTELWLQVKFGLFVLTSKHLAILCVCMIHRRVNNSSVASKIKRRVRKLSLQVGNVRATPIQRQNSAEELLRQVHMANMKVDTERLVQRILSTDSEEEGASSENGDDNMSTRSAESRFQNRPQAQCARARSCVYWTQCFRGYCQLLDENMPNFMHLSLIVLICVAACVHNSIISVIYILLLMTNRQWPKIVGHSGTWRIFLLIFTVSCLAQYAFILGLPPFITGEASTACVNELKRLGCTQFGKVGCLACSMQLPADNHCISITTGSNVTDLTQVNSFCGTTSSLAWFYETPVGNEYRFWLNLAQTNPAVIIPDCLILLFGIYWHHLTLSRMRRARATASVKQVPKATVLGEVESCSGGESMDDAAAQHSPIDATDDEFDFINAPAHTLPWRLYLKRGWFLWSTRVILCFVVLFACTSTSPDIFSGLYLFVALVWLYDPDVLLSGGNKSFRYLVIINWCIFFLFFIYQAPFFQSMRVCTPGTYICNVTEAESTIGSGNHICDSQTSEACVNIFETIGVYKVAGSSSCSAASCFYQCRSVEASCVRDSKCRECLSSWNSDEPHLRECAYRLQREARSSFELFAQYADCVSSCEIVQPSVVDSGSGVLPEDPTNIVDPQYCDSLQMLSFGRGLLSSLFILICLTIQSQIYSDKAFKFVQRHFQHHKDDSRSIRKLVQEHFVQLQQRNLDKANRMLHQSTEALKNIVAKVKVWERLLTASDASKDMARYSAQFQKVDRSPSRPSSPSSPEFGIDAGRAVLNGRARSISSTTSAAARATAAAEAVMVAAEAAEAAAKAERLNSLEDHARQESLDHLSFHPGPPIGVHCPTDGVSTVSIKLRWTHSNPHLVYEYRQSIHYLIYGQAIYDPTHPKSTLLDHFKLLAVVDCAGQYVTNGGRQPVAAAHAYDVEDILHGSVEATVRGLHPGTEYEFSVACRNIMLEDCGVTSFPVARTRTCDLPVQPHVTSMTDERKEGPVPRCGVFDIIEATPRSGPNASGSRKLTKKQFCGEHPVIYDGVGSVFRSHIAKGDTIDEHRNGACQKWTRLLLGEGVQQLLLPTQQGTLKNAGVDAESAAVDADLTEAINDRYDDLVPGRTPVQYSQVVRYLNNNLTMDQYCVLFPSSGRLDLLKHASGADVTHYRDLQKRIIRNHERVVRTYDRIRLLQDHERHKEHKERADLSIQEQLAMATEYLKRQSVQAQDPQLLAAVRQQSARAGGSKDGASNDDKDDDAEHEVLDIETGRRDSPAAPALSWGLWEPLEQYGPQHDGGGGRRSEQLRRTQRLRSKVQPVKFKNVVRCFLWATDAKDNTADEVDQDSDVHTLRAVELAVAASTTPDNKDYLKIAKLRRKAELNITLSGESEPHTTARLPRSAGITPSAADTGAQVSGQHLRPDRVCYAITLELVERAKELGASHDDEQAEHPYDRILWLQRNRATYNVTRTVTLIHVSQPAIQEMWQLIVAGVGPDVSCAVLPSFRQPTPLVPTFQRLPAQTRNPHFSGAHASSTTDDRHSQHASSDKPRDLRAESGAASPFHGLVYRLQHKYGIPLIDETLYPHWAERSIGSLLGASLLSNSLAILCLTVLIQNLANASILAMAVNFVIYCFLLTDYPRARSNIFRFLFGYMCGVILLKFVFQLPIFCQNMVVQDSGAIFSGQWYPSIQPWCPACHRGNCSDVQIQTYWLQKDSDPRVAFPAATSYANNTANGHPLIQWMHLFGIYKVDGSFTAEFYTIDATDNDDHIWASGIGFLGAIVWDILVVFALSFHRHNLISRGLWYDRDEGDSAEIESEAIPNEATPPLNKKNSFLSFLVRNSMVRRNDGTFQNEADERVGKDFYYATIWVQMCILLYAVFFYNGIVESNSESFTAQISNSQFSANLVVALIVILAVIIADRVIYLKKATLMKYILHVLCVVMIHIWAFLWVPLITAQPLGAMGTVFYLLVIGYLVLQSRQLYHGYYRLPDRNAVISYGYNTVPKYIFFIYRYFPLLYEMRNILDWTCASTSLYLFMWLRVEQIYSSLFLVKCNMRKFRYNHVGFRWGRDQSSAMSYLFGAGCIAIAVLAVILPLYLFSSLNPSQETNPVLTIDATLSIVVTSYIPGAGSRELGTYPLWKSNQYQKLLNYSDTMWSSLRANLTDQVTGLCPLIPDYQNISQLIELVDYSQDSWSASPPSQQSLLAQLTSATSSAQARLSVNFHRTTGGDVSFESTSSPINSTRLATLLRNASQGTMIVDSNSTVLLDELFPQAIHLFPKEGAAAQALDTSRSTYQSAYLGLHVAAWPPNSNTSENSVAYWVLYGSSSTGVDKGFNLTVVSDKSIAATTTAVLSLIGATSVTSFYIVVVLGLAGLSKTFFARPLNLVPMEEMPQPDELIEVCKGIHTLRAQGKLKDEMQMFKVLLRICRSQESLLRITKTKWDTIPATARIRAEDRKSSIKQKQD